MRDTTETDATILQQFTPHTEPTNHIDVAAALFLEKWLVEKNQTILIVSHDSHFLDAVCTDIIQVGQALFACLYLGFAIVLSFICTHILSDFLFIHTSLKTAA